MPGGRFLGPGIKAGVNSLMTKNRAGRSDRIKARAGRRWHRFRKIAEIMSHNATLSRRGTWRYRTMRLLLVLLAVFHAANGLFMLTVPEAWYAAVPGVVETGPANSHFIRDIGLGFLAAAAALGLAARNGGAALLVPAIVFLSGHAGLHLVEMAAHGTTPATALRDTLLILIPGFLPLHALWWERNSLVGRAA
jgi:hypothetical protein